MEAGRDIGEGKGEKKGNARALLSISMKKAAERRHGSMALRSSPRARSVGRSARQNIVWKNGSQSQVTQEGERGNERGAQAGSQAGQDI